jgi:hypothetical protein
MQVERHIQFGGRLEDRRVAGIVEERATTGTVEKSADTTQFANPAA